ncbi:MAG: hypothetical protein A2Y41_01875 [Spirochaetes bacterium GWB1_36_13]|nr:MAG: hypothetical protein A2Y41_01875 [Spirochaetes bacterium GWB1_36_13]
MNSLKTVLTAKFKALKGFEKELEKVLKSLLLPTRNEKGCILYNLHKVAGQEDEFLFYEIWEDRDSLQKHQNSDHFINALPEIKKFSSQPAEVVFMILSD